VSNWSILKNYKKNWNSTKISVTSGMHLTREGSMQRPLTSRPSGGRPVPLCSLSWVGFTGTLSKRRSQGIQSWKSMKARLSGRSTTWLGRPGNIWCVTDLIKSVNPLWTPINTAPYWWNPRHHILLVVFYL
jgi:hypothetical protein